ncbi:mediator-associated protein 2 [Corylus avellana]|uniref:mediator-associated protein 2 n=1 Tax=Corylus avellana TaxID=13451 RepID=UPI001E21A56A|nr:mediator-associated protein 2 [Corylus avellana]XP_059429999.1 mediator-associated protein 2 [Corylus avellana]
MDSDDEQGYKPLPEFQLEAKEPLIDLSSTDSTELWLIRLPPSKPLPGVDGQEMSLQLHQDGQSGSFDNSSGKVCDLSFVAQESNATVFLNSASDSKIVGKISRLVNLIYHPEPDEIKKPNPINLRHFQKSRGLSLTNSSPQFSMQSTMLRGSQLTSGHPSSHSSRQRSSLSEVGEPSKTPKRRRVHNSPVSMERSQQDSGRGHSAITSSGGSSGRSHHHKSKKTKIVKNEE